MNRNRIEVIITRTALSFVLCLALIGAKAQGFQFEVSDGTILLKENTQPVFRYQKATKSLNGAYPRANYLHPLYGRNGETLTEDFPEDHLHHRGIFWAWHQLIVDGSKVGDPWECKGIEWEVEKVDTTVTKGNAKLETWVNWKGAVAGAINVVVKEKTTITTYPSTNGQRSIDFNIQLTAGDRDVRLGGSEDAKGYSGFSTRIKLPDDVAFTSHNGRVTPIETAIKAGGWIDMTASFEGGTSGVVLMADTTTVQPFHGWILRSKNSMQNAAFPGRQPVKIAVGETLTMRYRLVIHEEPVAATEIQQLYLAFLSARRSTER